jgi:predicted glycoside hydrolase/deacetylase ChbG (UPF0249 family)
MKRLVVTADDFGLTDGVCAGILEALAGGVVSCTSAMMAFPGAADRVARHAARLPAARLGLHLQLTSGAPCAGSAVVPTLVDPTGRFPRHRAAFEGLRPEEIDREFRAQLRRMHELGLQPSHLDSHHHVHQRRDAMEPFADLARSTALRARSGPPPVDAVLTRAGVRHADRFEGGWFGEPLTVDALVALVEGAFMAIGGSGTVELMCHPGRCDAALEAVSGYTREREQELAVFCAPDLPARLADLAITIVPHGAI